MSFTLNSGVVIFDVIEILWDSPKTKGEFCQKLKEKNLPSDSETISKYIRTLRKSGFLIVYKDATYQLLDTPFKNKTRLNSCGVDITFSLIRELFVQKMASREKGFEEKIFNIFDFDKEVEIEKNIEIYFKNNGRISKNLFVLNKAILRKESLNFVFQKKKFLVKPKELIYKKNGIFLVAYNEAEEIIQNFRLDKIKKIKIVKNEDVSFYERKNATTFKLIGRMIKNYILREGEIAHYKDDCVLVTNYREEKNQLFSRLLRYGKYCEVVFPDTDRELFKEKVKELIKYYKKL